MTGRLVVITGASRGIGAEVAVWFAAMGDRLVLLARSSEGLEATAQRCRAAGAADVHLRTLDLRDLSAVEAAASTLLDTVGVPDVVVCNAGHSINREALDQHGRLHDHLRLMNLNHLGHVALLLPWLPAMTARGSGRIVYTSSAVARVPTPGWSTYVASKGAFDLWLRSVGPELRRHGVTTCPVELGLVATDMIVPRQGGRARFASSPRRAADRVVKAALGTGSFSSPWWARVGAALSAIMPGLSAELVGRFSLGRPRTSSRTARPCQDGQ